MGRFASTVEFYARLREPYLPKFFAAIAEKIQLRGHEHLLDVGCGPGLLAIGFAPFVGTVTALDPEPAMIAAAQNTAAQAGAAVSLHLGKLEEFDSSEKYDVVVLGRSLHWLEREAALRVLGRIVSESGHILTCGAFNGKSPLSPWVKPYEDVRRSWADDPEQKRYRIDEREWFAGSGFHYASDVSVRGEQDVTIDDLIGRALSKSNTSPDVVAERRGEFEEQLREALRPFAAGGILHEQILNRATIFSRP